MAAKTFPLSSLAARANALPGAGSDLPSVWTPEHVVRRIVHALRVLQHTPVKGGPSTRTGGWPPALLAAAQARDAWFRSNVPQHIMNNLEEPISYDKDALDDKGNPIPRFARDLPSRYDVALMEEALTWPLSHLSEPIQADALSIYCLGLASRSFEVQPLLADRLKTATLLAWTTAARREDDEAKRLAGLGITAEMEGIDALPADVRITVLASSMRRKIARTIAAAVNEEIKNIASSSFIRDTRIEARDEFIRRCDAADLTPVGADDVQAVMPGVCLYRWQVDRHRKRAAERIAATLHAKEVAVR